MGCLWYSPQVFLCQLFLSSEESKSQGVFVSTMSVCNLSEKKVSSRKPIFFSERVPYMWPRVAPVTP